jgi:uncharacterized protein (TIGR02391 family)
MNLQTAVDPRLWHAIEGAFVSGSYTTAILNAIYFVGDLIRDKTGLQSDGVALIGQAFGGKAPALKVNKLQTESERNVQAGLEQLLKGIYQGIRNPRSHEKTSDSLETAVAIILFLNYLVNLIDKTKAIFSQTEFMNRVFDKNFVASERYAKLLVSEIPLKQRLDVAIAVYRQKRDSDGDKLKFFTHDLYKELTEEEQSELHVIISDELKSTDDEADLKLTLQLFPNELLERLPEIARLRLENRLLKSVSEGDYDQRTNRCRKGGLGTWLSARLNSLLLKSELIEILTAKLFSADTDEHAYVVRYFYSAVESEAINPSRRLCLSLKNALRGGSVAAKELVDRLIFGGNEKIGELLAAEIKDFEQKNPSPFADDEIPF